MPYISVADIRISLPGGGPWSHLARLVVTGGGEMRAGVLPSPGSGSGSGGRPHLSPPSSLSTARNSANLPGRKKENNSERFSVNLFFFVLLFR